MIIKGAKLRINDMVFNVLQMDYAFYKKTDDNGCPVSGIRGGDIRLLLEADENNSLLRKLLLDEISEVEGHIEVMAGEDEHRIRYIEFEKACIYSQNEEVYADGAFPLLMMVVITSLRLDINHQVRLARLRSQNCGLCWQEYNPDRNESAGKEVTE